MTGVQTCALPICIPQADIRQEDTIRRPQHKEESNELKRYDRVLANPPVSQNFIRKDIEYPGRFAVWLPEKGKKADLMGCTSVNGLVRQWLGFRS